MLKLDKQNRIHIPVEVLNASKINLNEDVMIYVEKDVFFISNPSAKFTKNMCFGKLYIDVHKRFVIPKQIRELMNIDRKANLLCFIKDNIITFKKI